MSYRLSDIRQAPEAGAHIAGYAVAMTVLLSALSSPRVSAVTLLVAVAAFAIGCGFVKAADMRLREVAN